MNRIRKSYLFMTLFMLFLAFLLPFSTFVSANPYAAENVSLSKNKMVENQI